MTLLAACDPAATDPAPPPTPPPPATRAPPLAAEPAMPLPVAQPLELALSWPRRAQVALTEILERTSWRVSITPTGPAAIEQLAGAASGADLVSPADPARMAAAGGCRLYRAGRSWRAVLAGTRRPSPAAIPAPRSSPCRSRCGRACLLFGPTSWIGLPTLPNGAVPLPRWCATTIAMYALPGSISHRRCTIRAGCCSAIVTVAGAAAIRPPESSSCGRCL